MRIYKREERSQDKSNVVYVDTKKQPLNLLELFKSVQTTQAGSVIIVTREALMEILERAINAEADVMLS